MSLSTLRLGAASLLFAASSNCTPGIISIQPTSGTPAYVASSLFPGTQVNIVGVKICDPATKVDLGADTTVATVDLCTTDADKATTHVQRLSTDGAIQLTTGTTLPAAPMASPQSFSVRTMRNQNG